MLTVTDRKRNAALAVMGAIIGALSLVWELVLALQR